jgi:hypothetical protein
MFVLRMTPGAAGDLAGLIQHVRSGEKRRFEGLAGLGEAIRVMLRGHSA